MADFKGKRSPSRAYVDSLLQRVLDFGLRQDGDAFTLVATKRDEAVRFAPLIQHGTTTGTTM